jgi:hypothetical protein
MAPDELFWSLAEEMYADPRVSRSTMMGFPCVRVDGKFFASLDNRDHRMIVKLPEERVTALVMSGSGQEFAPAGRVFREWVAFADPDEAAWRDLLEEAKAFVAGST